MSAANATSASIKAGVFLTFCLGLLVAMLFVYGKFSRSWRGRAEMHVLFVSVGQLRTDAPVRYNGMEVGRVRALRIVPVTPELLAKLPPFDGSQGDFLPLSDEEQDSLGGLPPDAFNEKVRAIIAGRNMVEVEMDVLLEGEAKRFKEDDQYKIGASLMGESAIEIVSGVGTPVDMEHPRFILGASGDMFANLDKSVKQVKDIMTGMSEMVGGEGDVKDSPLAKRLNNFSQFTARVDEMTENFEQTITRTWDTLEKRADEGRERLEALKGSIKNMQPETQKMLEKAQQAILDARVQFLDSSNGGLASIRQMRASMHSDLETLGKTLTTYKKDLPTKVHDMRVFTEDVRERVEQIDRGMSEADATLTQGVQGIKQQLKGLQELADVLETKSWLLTNYPYAALSEPGRVDEGIFYDSEHKRALMARHFKELKSELAVVQSGSKAADTSDKSRLDRIAALAAELETYLAPPPAKPLAGKSRDE